MSDTSSCTNGHPTLKRSNEGAKVLIEGDRL